MAKKKLSELEKKINSTKLPIVNPAFDKVISYSQFSIWSSCPHRWKLKYIDKKEPYQASIHTVFGTAFHETIQSYIKTMYEVSGAAADKMDLKTLFETNFRNEYVKEYTSSGGHFTSAEEMGEFFDDALAILHWIQKRRNKLFTIRNMKLLGIELPLVLKMGNNLYFQAYIDFVLYDEDLKKIYIYDIKTSTRGWGDKERKDESKIAQILLYKEYFAKQFGVEVDSIEVEFFIVKRKIWEESEYPIPRVQSFKPASGKNKRSQTVERFQKFIEDCFDESGKYKIKSYIKNVGESSCKWCPFADKPDLCDKSNVLE